jgi:hypothetical protein
MKQRVMQLLLTWTGCNQTKNLIGISGKCLVSVVLLWPVNKAGCCSLCNRLHFDIFSAKYNENEEHVPELAALQGITQQYIPREELLRYEVWALQRMGWILCGEFVRRVVI